MRTLIITTLSSNKFLDDHFITYKTIFFLFFFAEKPEFRVGLVCNIQTKKLTTYFLSSVELSAVNTNITVASGFNSDAAEFGHGSYKSVLERLGVTCPSVDGAP